MTGATHLTTGIAGALIISYLTGAPVPVCLAAGVIGSLLPDIDHPQSMLSGYIPGSGLVLSLGLVRHRGVTHSLLFAIFATLLLSAGAAGLAEYFDRALSLLAIHGLVLSLGAGILLHLAGDMLTPQGVPLFYPSRRNWKIAPGFILRLGKFFGLFELAVWLAALAVSFLCAGLLTGIVRL